MTSRFFYLSALLLAILACGSGSRDQAFLISPQTPSVAVGEKLQLLAQPNIDIQDEPQWEMVELNGGAFLNPKGLRVTYVAPQAAGTYRAALRFHKADGSLAKFIQEIQVLPSIQVEPSHPVVRTGQSVQLSAKVRGVPKTAVNWYLEDETGGQIQADGLYTAPQRPGTYRVVASVEGYAGALGYGTIRVE